VAFASRTVGVLSDVPLRAPLRFDGLLLLLLTVQYIRGDFKNYQLRLYYTKDNLNKT